MSASVQHVIEKPMALRKWSHEQITQAFSSLFIPSLFFLISLLIVFKYAIRKTKTKTNLNQLPSPPKLPFIGNLHQLGTLPHRSLRDLSLKYGNMMLLQLGQKQTPTLVISSGEVAMEIMKNHDIVFSNRPQHIAPKILLYGCTEVGFGNYGENWRQKRKICVLELLSVKSVKSFQGIREEEVEEMVSKLREASSKKTCVNLSKMFVSTTNNIVCKSALGRKCEGDGNVKELARKVMIYLTTFVVGDYFPSLGWIDVLSGKIGEFKDTFRALDALFDKVIEERLALKKIEKDQFEKKGFVDMLLQLKEDGMLGFELTNNDIKGILMDMFVGGTDTTSATLEWTISELVRHPSTMKKVQEEVRRVVSNKSKVEESDINQMPFLKCVVKEILRLHPATPLMAPRETMSRVNLKGYDIPEKTMVYVNNWAIQRDPKNWENPEEFIPERFEHSQVDFRGQDFQFIPFGFGRRGCPGVNFGIATVEYILANLLYWFDWETKSGKQDIDMSEVFGLVVSMKEPLHLKPIAFSF
ncbi:cytochrome P450 71A1-like [Vicia villosa]|uniref:cytochrome P450 71A1-like n=1 Tax=Vicia villosa TaxID=3911 RepID=UPI00273A9F5A|nr:cytochrome P450 71A1-like [Vicia villosa]